MRVPVEWLYELCDPGWEPEETAERLSMSGTEVERISGGPPELGSEFVVGEVLAVDPHPDADRLRVCRVDADGERTIVCGAPNVASGQRVAVALPGATLPDGTELRKAKLRGIVSEGMILSEVELGIGEEADGIMVLGEGAEPGARLADALGDGGQTLDLEVTTNRPDCLSIYGVARELHAVSGAPLAAAPWEGVSVQESATATSEMASIEVAVPDLCPRFSVRAFSGVEVGPSPEWLRERLRAAGYRPINNVVDITNYVMLLTGQPLHAFDLDAIVEARLDVRRAAEGESIDCLDGVDRVLPSGTIVISDGEGLVSIAGIMGGGRTQVQDATTNVLLEAATWDGSSILRASRALALRTEASARFEKGLHPELCDRAQALAGKLLVDLSGAGATEGILEIYPKPPKPRRLELRPARASALVGMEISSAECLDRLGALGFGVSGSDGEGAIAVDVPPERDGDVRREVDLVEEVARLGDLDRNLPATIPQAASAGGLSRPQRLRRRSEDFLRDGGFAEIVSWSFASVGLADALLLPADHDARNAIEVANPLASDQAVMRTLMLGGLLDGAKASTSHGAEGVRLFESGRVYLRGLQGQVRGSGPEAGEFVGLREPPAQEEQRLAALLVGPTQRGWREQPVESDFFTAKGVLEGLFAALGVEAVYRSADEPFLHPSRAASVALDGVAIGWVGELHPRVLAAWDLPASSGFELALAPVLGEARAGEERYREPSTFPPVREDLSVVVGDELSADALTAAAQAAASELLSEIELIDVYESEDLGADLRSLTFRLVFRAEDRTLTDPEVAEARNAIIEAVESLGGEVRG